MNDDRNRSQIIRIDARNCFVESLNDAFEIGKAHFTFASYDLSKPSGQRQTNSIQIYIDMAEVLELCRKLMGGELRYLMQVKKKNGDSTPLYQCLGGTSAEKLARYGRARADGKSLSRTVPFPVSWTVKMKKKQKETQDILSYHTQAAGCSDKARAKASGGRQPIEECGRTGL